MPSSLPTLYHAKGTCSLAVLMAGRDMGVDMDVVEVSLRSKQTRKGENFLKINPLGQVSTLRTLEGALITETSSVLMWVQNQAGLYPVSDPHYYQILRWVGFCATEIHKALFRVVFYNEATDKVKENFRMLARSRLNILEAHLDLNPFVASKDFSAADAYLTWACTLLGKAGIDINAWPNLKTYSERIMARPAIKAVIVEDTARTRF